MSQDNEITALRASGVNLLVPMLPALVVSATLAVGLTLFNNYVLPETNHAFANLVTDIHRIRPTAQIQEGVFIDDFEGYSLFIRRLDDRTGRMRDILIIDASENRTSPRTIIARQGNLKYLPEQNVISLTLRNGEIHEADPNAPDGRYHRLAFEEQTLNLKGASEAMARSVRRGRGQREMSVGAMRAEVVKLRGELRTFETQIDSSLTRLGVTEARQLPPLDPEERRPGGIRRLAAALAGLLTGRRAAPEPAPEASPTRRRQIEELRVQLFQAEGVRKRIDQFSVEIEKKFSIPFACLVFVLVGAPLGIRARRGGLTVGFLSVAFFLFYYLCLIGGEQLADRGMMPPWLAMWLPNLVLGLLGIRLTYRAASAGFPISSSRRNLA